MQHLSPESVAELLQVSRDTVLDLIHRGELDAIKLGDFRSAHLRISEESFRAFLERRKVQPKTPAKAAR